MKFCSDVEGNTGATLFDRGFSGKRLKRTHTESYSLVLIGIVKEFVVSLGLIAATTSFRTKKSFVTTVDVSNQAVGSSSDQDQRKLRNSKVDHGTSQGNTEGEALLILETYTESGHPVSFWERRSSSTEIMIKEGERQHPLHRVRAVYQHDS